MKIISEDLRELVHHGIQVGQKRYFIALVGAKGDLKWHSKIGKFTRGFEHQGRVVDKCCCHVCLAGTSDLPAEDLGAEPSWVRTIYEERPWGEADDEQPSLIRIPYDMSRPEAMYKHDILHTLRLGVFRDYTGSTVFLLLRWNYFGDSGTVNTKLEAAHGHFKLWLAANGKSAALRSFTKQLLQYKNKKSFPWFNVKASDCNLIMKWIATLLVGILNEQPPSWQVPVLQALLATCQCGLSFYGGVCNHTMFLPRVCAAALFEQGQSFLNGYMFAAKWAFENEHCLYGVKPKHHFMKHMLLEIKQQVDAGDPLVASPLLWDCAQNEDLIGRVCRLGRKADGRTLSSRVLQNYLIKASLLAKREVKKIKKR